MKIGYTFLGGWPGPDTTVQTVLVCSQLLMLTVAQNKLLMVVFAGLRRGPPCVLVVGVGGGCLPGRRWPGCAGGESDGPGAGVQDDGMSVLTVAFCRCVLGLAVTQRPLLRTHGSQYSDSTNLPLMCLAGVLGKCAFSLRE